MNSTSKRSLLEILFKTPAVGRSVAIVVALLPFLQLAFLFIVNPAYMSNFFLPDVRGIGFLMLSVAILLSLFSYALLWRCWSIIDSGRRLQGVILATLVMGFLAFPAVLIAVLGPAALLLLNATR